VSRFLVVCPQLSKRRRWGGNKLEFLREDTTVVEALVTTAIRDHHGDASRLILTGFSFGGEGAFQVASVSKLTWSTIWAVDPALQRVPPVPAPSVRVWVHHGNEQPGAPSMGDFANALDLQPSNGVPTARRVMTALKTNHPETCIAAYAEARVYDWLLR
jgi:dienelactone hydrolase